MKRAQILRTSQWNIVIGTQYPPVVLVGLLTASDVTASAVLKQAFDPKSLYNASTTVASIELMTMTTIARLSNGDMACGMFVGNYFDGDLPPDFFVSKNNGQDWGVYPTKLANTNLRNMVLDPQGQLCMATDGCGLICVP